LRPDLAILTMAGFLDARPRVGYFYTGKTGSELLTEKVKQLKVRHFQSVPVVVKESDTVYDAVSAMFLGDVGTLFVLNDVNNVTTYPRTMAETASYTVSLSLTTTGTD